MSDYVHLSVEIVERIHRSAIANFGGAGELRSAELLESAVLAAQASLGGQSVFADVVEVAAAYLFYLCSNHPFVDGNKQTALGACLIYLQLNGVELPPDSAEWEHLTVDIAAGNLDRKDTTERLRGLLET